MRRWILATLILSVASGLTPARAATEPFIDPATVNVRASDVPIGFRLVRVMHGESTPLINTAYQQRTFARRFGGAVATVIARVTCHPEIRAEPGVPSFTVIGGATGAARLQFKERGCTVLITVQSPRTPEPNSKPLVPPSLLVRLAHIVDGRIKTALRSLTIGQSVPKPTAAPAAALAVRAVVTPNTMSYNAYPVLTAYSNAGASCSARVVYSTGRTPVSFNGAPQTVGSAGSVAWRWHEETKGTGGLATVTCTLAGRSATAQASFAVVNA